MQYQACLIVCDPDMIVAKLLLVYDSHITTVGKSE
jgi:hypothetical protein